MSWRTKIDELPRSSVESCLQITSQLAHGDVAAAARTELGTGASQENLWDAIRAHQLVPFIAGTFGQANEHPRRSARLNRRIQGWLHEQQARRQRAARMLDLLVTTLRQASVEFLVLKGMPLAHRFYGRVDLRATRDLDILVRRSDIDVCLHVLRPLGFKYKDRRRNPISRYRIRTEHAASLIHGETELDLHWRLRNNAVHRIGEASLWEEADDHQWESGDCRVLSPHHELLLLLLSAAHDIERGACRIKHLLDTYVLVRRIHDELDWKQYLHDRAVEITLGECLNVLGLVLILLARPGEFVELRRALDDHRDRIVCRDRADAIALVSAKRGSVANQRWFAKVSPAWHWRSLVRTLDRNVLRPGRIPWLMIKTARHLFAPASEPRR